VNANKEYRAGMKKLSVGLKITFAEYREYQQAMAAYKDKLDRVDQLKRRVEQQVSLHIHASVFVCLFCKNVTGKKRVSTPR